jgi:primase-polymerase (primpol)-like protein
VKLAKIPVNPQSLLNADTTDPTTWGEFSHCIQALPVALEEWEHDNPADYRGGGLGYVFSEADPFVGIDFDACVDATTGELAPWAQQSVHDFASYTEITPSSTGLHIIVEGTLPPKGRKKGHIEMYSYARFFTMTGWHLDETPGTIEARPGPLAALWGQLFGPHVGERVWALDAQGTITNPTPWTIREIAYAPSGEPYALFVEGDTGRPLLQCEVVTGNQGHAAPLVLGDTTIIQKATAAANKDKLLRLAQGNWQQDYASQSEGDLAFCCMLAFWTTNPDQIDRLFRTTGLLRAKWDEQRGTATYGQRTIAEALARQTEHYTPHRVPPPVRFSTLATHVPRRLVTTLRRAL